MRGNVPSALVTRSSTSAYSIRRHANTENTIPSANQKREAITRAALS